MFFSSVNSASPVTMDRDNWKELGRIERDATFFWNIGNTAEWVLEGWKSLELRVFNGNSRGMLFSFDWEKLFDVALELHR